jgi:2-succinyl-5-enolpyruvyl-6-hydroxy-3-cyclohexene-1-carboxylate synthase
MSKTRSLVKETVYGQILHINLPFRSLLVPSAKQRGLAQVKTKKNILLKEFIQMNL